MRIEEEIRADIERTEKERDLQFSKGNNEIGNLLNGRYWALKWVLKEQG